MRVEPNRLGVWRSAPRAAGVSVSLFVRSAVVAAVDRDLAERRRGKNARTERPHSQAAILAVGVAGPAAARNNSQQNGLVNVSIGKLSVLNHANIGVSLPRSQPTSAVSVSAQWRCSRQRRRNRHAANHLFDADKARQDLRRNNVPSTAWPARCLAPRPALALRRPSLGDAPKWLLAVKPVQAPDRWARCEAAADKMESVGGRRRPTRVAHTHGLRCSRETQKGHVSSVEPRLPNPCAEGCVHLAERPLTCCLGA